MCQHRKRVAGHPVFQEANRIIRKGGLFVFVVGDRSENEAPAVEVGAEHTKSEKTVTVYLHSEKQIAELMARYGFEPLRDLSFTVFMDRERTKCMPARSYLAKKSLKLTAAAQDTIEPDPGSHSPN
jgi:predicted TPR repeat methyltransferase